MGVRLKAGIREWRWERESEESVFGGMFLYGQIRSSGSRRCGGRGCVRKMEEGKGYESVGRGE